MTAVLTHNSKQGDFARGLTRRFTLLLFLFLILSGGTYYAVSSAVSAKEYDSIVLNIAGRQRMLIQKYVREINQVLVCLAVSDWEMAVEMKEAAALTAENFDETLAAFLEGGEVHAIKEGRIWIPPAQGDKLGGHLVQARNAWALLRRAVVKALRSNSSTLVRNHYVRDIQVQTSKAEAEMNHAVWLMQKQSEVRLHQVTSYMIYACVLSLLLFMGTIVFVRKKIVAPLDHSMSALANEIDERKLMDKVLRRSLADAESAAFADQAKSDFLANMSHEIRTPMTAILGFAENLLDADQSKSEKLNAIHTIRRNGDYLLGIINDILDLSKVEAGKMETKRVSCEPCAIIAEVLSLVRVKADAKGLALEIEYDGAIPKMIRTDPTRLRQILINLTGNAIKFTEKGTIRILTRCVDEGEGPRLQIDVIDTGEGMPEEAMKRLFQPFTQVDNSTTRKIGGTGLGLTISKRFAELLGGDIIVVKTELGVGSTFRATVATGSLDGVSMLRDPLAATTVAEDSNIIDQAPPSDLRGAHILLAEDNPTNQMLVSGILKKAGAKVTVVKDGKLALDAALAARDDGHPFDVILMDIQMPIMGGYEATRLLREEGYTGSIIALTANAMDGDREKCIKAGCDDYATKPIVRKKLLMTIHQQLASTVVAVRTCD